MRPLLSLVMIVKDEAASIEKTLLSCKPAIDRWTILDTGSTDGTQDIIRRVMEGTPGKLATGPFVDFATTRNAVLGLETDATFALMLSGDETLENPLALKNFCEEQRDKADGAYYVQMAVGASRWNSGRITRVASQWRYVGAIHEVLMGPGGQIPLVTTPGAYIRHEMLDPERRMQRYRRDLEILQKEHAREPANTRTVFYLAQTYECLGNKGKAIETYQKRIDMSGWREEVFEASLRLAKLQDKWSGQLVHFLEAYHKAPHRCEPLYEIGLHYYRKGMPAVAMLFARKAAELPYPKDDTLFVVESYYRWQAHDLVACCAGNDKALGLESAKKALAGNPTDVRLQNNVKNLENLTPRAPREKFAVCIVSFPGYIHSQCFEEIAESVHQGLLRLGRDSIRTTDLSVNDRRLIVFGAHLLGSSYVLPTDTIIYNLEQVGAANVTAENLALYKKYTLWDYSKENIRRLAEQGVVAKHVPLGYIPALTKISKEKEDIDVLFYGALNPRRTLILEKLKDAGLNVVSLTNVYGADRDACIARAKIVVNIHFYETKIFEAARVLYLLANKKCVVTEDSVDQDFEEGLIVASYDDIVDTCSKLVKDEKRRNEIAERGFALVQQRDVSRYLKEVLI